MSIRRLVIAAFIAGALVAGILHVAWLGDEVRELKEQCRDK